MSNCHSSFLKLARNISLTGEEMSKLQRSRNAVERRIRKYFNESRDGHNPIFKPQGSFAMGTIIRPRAGRYDLDLGVYFKNLIGNPSGWPTTETIHRHIVNGISGHTSFRPVDKKPCVRLIYKSPYTDRSDLAYHIDLPVYGFKKGFWDTDYKTVIGFKGEAQWSLQSCPESFENWFKQMCDKNPIDPQQLVRIVKYLKAWKEEKPKYPKLPDGMMLTVLCGKNFEPHERDDIAFYNTIVGAYNKINLFLRVVKPTEPFDNLASDLTDRQKQNFLYRLSELIDTADYAIEQRNQYDSIEIWQECFGFEFGH